MNITGKVMEKVKSNTVFIFSLAHLCVLFVSIVIALFISKDLENFPIQIIKTFLIFSIGNLIAIPMYFSKEKDLKIGIKFSNDGIAFPESNNEVVPWDSLEVSHKNINPYLREINVYVSDKTKGITTDYDLNSFNAKSLIELTKKYCPKNHTLYKMIEEYAKKRNLVF